MQLVLWEYFKLENELSDNDCLIAKLLPNILTVFLFETPEQMAS